MESPSSPIRKKAKEGRKAKKGNKRVPAPAPAPEYVGPDPTPKDLSLEERLVFIPGGYTRIGGSNGHPSTLGRIRIAGVDRNGVAEPIGNDERELRRAFKTPGNLRGWPVRGSAYTAKGIKLGERMVQRKDPKTKKGLFVKDQDGQHVLDEQGNKVPVMVKVEDYASFGHVDDKVPGSQYRRPELGTFCYLRSNGFGDDDAEYTKKLRRDHAREFDLETTRLMVAATNAGAPLTEKWLTQRRELGEQLHRE
tara:strand:- start:1044 stop:1796 length:753 start_codon:yes stop_codon:yes gene_type:complete